MSYRRVSLALVSLTALFALTSSACSRSDAPRERQQPTNVAPTERAAAPQGPQYDAEDRLGLVGRPVMGGANALVTIVEFSSFQCPFCGRVQPTLKQILDEFGDDVRLVFKQHPLPMQQNSRPAANASLAAHAQGKFWEYHALLMENQRALSRADLERYAEQVGLDMDRFRADMDSNAYDEMIDADLATATRFGIRGTPNFLINGRNVVGAQPFEAFASVVREEIAATRGLVEGGQTVAQAFGARLTANLREGGQAERPQEERPRPDPNARIRVPVGNSPTKGGTQPLVTIVEFSSYQCPFCNRVRPTLQALMEEYGDDLQVVFKHRPLGFQANSEPAARAAIAAQNQGKFWEFHAMLFDNQSQLTRENFERFARELGLDMDRFIADLDSEATAARLREDTSLADTVQAQGTPHFFINGMRLAGAQPVDAFKAVIDREIANARRVIEGGVPRAQVYTNLMASAAERPPMIGGGGAQEQREARPVEIPVGDSPTRGPRDARVTVIEFSDFQCGFCGRLSETLAEVMPEFEDRVLFVSKQFPLGRWPISQTASEAALAANAQGKYWEFKSLIYQNQRGLTEEQLFGFAESLGLNMDRFRADMSEGRFRAQVTQEQGHGRSAGVSGTPALFVNGRQIGGAIPADQLRQAIRSALGN